MSNTSIDVNAHDGDNYLSEQDIPTSLVNSSQESRKETLTLGSEDEGVTVRTNEKLQKCRKWVANYWRAIFALAFPAVLIGALSFLLFDTKNEQNKKVGQAIFLYVLVFTFWITQTVPIPVTALIAFFASPLMGIKSSDEFVGPYGLLFSEYLAAGGFCLALSYEFCNLQHRIALKIILIVGAHPKRLLRLVLFVSFFLSLLLPISFVIPLMSTVIVALMTFIQECLLDDNQFFRDEGLFGSTAPSPVSSTNSQLDLFGESEEAMVTSHPTRANRRLTKEEIKSLKSESKQKRCLMHLQWTESFTRNTKIMLLLACYYSSLMGNAGQLIGGAYLSLKSCFQRDRRQKEAVAYPNWTNNTKVDIDYYTWTTFAMFPTLLNVAFCYVFLEFWFLWRKNFLARYNKTPELTLTEDDLKKIDMKQHEAYKKLGKLRLHEIEVLCLSVFQAIFLITAEMGDTFSYQSTFGWGCVRLINLIMLIVPRTHEFFCSRRKQDAGHVKYVLDWNYMQRYLLWGIFFTEAASNWLLDVARNYAGIIKICFDNIIPPIAHRQPELVLLVSIIMSSVLAELLPKFRVVHAMIPYFLNYEKDCGYMHYYLTFPIALASWHMFLLPGFCLSCCEATFVFFVGKMKMMDFILPGICLKIASSIILFLCTLSWGAIFLQFRPSYFKRCHQ